MFVIAARGELSRYEPVTPAHRCLMTVSSRILILACFRPSVPFYMQIPTGYAQMPLKRGAASQIGETGDVGSGARTAGLSQEPLPRVLDSWCGCLRNQSDIAAVYPDHNMFSMFIGEFLPLL